MANKKEEVAVQKAEEETGVDAPWPSYIPRGDNRGLEDMTKDDVQMPRIRLAQAQSPQMLKAEPKFIQGLQLGQMFNDLTEEIYGFGPLPFAIVRRDRPRYIEFDPDTRKVVDFDVPAGDPRTKFTTDPKTNKRVQPIATQFYDYIIALLPLGANPMESMIALSMSSTNINVAKKLNMLAMKRSCPLFAGKYVLKSVDAKSDKGAYSMFGVANAGFVSQEEFMALESLFGSIKDKEIKIDREPGDDTGEEGLAGDM